MLDGGDEVVEPQAWHRGFTKVALLAFGRSMAFTTDIFYVCKKSNRFVWTLLLFEGLSKGYQICNKSKMTFWRTLV